MPQDKPDKAFNLIIRGEHLLEAFPQNNLQIHLSQNWKEY